VDEARTGDAGGGEAGTRDQVPEVDTSLTRPEDDVEAPSGQGALRVPFGPFLALGALEFYFFGDAILSAYFDFVGL
jgi:hypothetical protein